MMHTQYGISTVCLSLYSTSTGTPKNYGCWLVIFKIWRVSVLVCGVAQSVTFGPSVEAIGASAFAGTGLTSVDLNNVQTIGWNVFEGCTSLESVNTGDNVRIIPSAAFQKCRVCVQCVRRCCGREPA